MFEKNKMIVKIEGMHCEHCAKRVENALKDIEGVTKIKIDLKNKQAVILGKCEIDKEKIKSTITELGYEIIEIA